MSDEQEEVQPKKEKEPGKIRQIFGFASKLTDKIPEGPILGHVIPGWMAAHKVISTFIVAAVALPVGAVILGGAHAWWNSSYTDDYKAVLDDIAKQSAITCSLEDVKRKVKIYKAVQSDVRDSGDTGIMTLAFSPVSMIPYIGNIAPSFEFLPNKKIHDALLTAQENNIQFYPGNGFDEEVRAVIFNDGEKPPIMVYDDLDNGELVAIMSAVNEGGGLQQGTLALTWNDAREAFEVQQGTLDATQVPVLDGLANVPMPENSCYTNNSMSERFKGWIGFGGDDEEPETEELETATEESEPEAETLESAEQAPEKTWSERLTGWIPGVGGGDEDKIIEEGAPDQTDAPAPIPN